MEDENGEKTRNDAFSYNFKCIENVYERSTLTRDREKGRESLCVERFKVASVRFHYNINATILYTNHTFELDILVKNRAARKKRTKLLQSHTEKNIRILA